MSRRTGGRGRIRWRAVGAALLVLGLALVVQLWRQQQPTPPAGPSGLTGDAAVADAFRSRTSGLMVEVSGNVERTLPDDREGARHQRFIVELSGGHTLLISHNIDLAPRVPIETDATIRFRGEYEWNEQGGVVHWTHHDPRGRRAGGWVEYEGRRYE